MSTTTDNGRKEFPALYRLGLAMLFAPMVLMGCVMLYTDPVAFLAAIGFGLLITGWICVSCWIMFVGAGGNSKRAPK